MAQSTIEIGRRGVAGQLADVVREARLLVGWSQRELADRAGTSHTTIWRIEDGRSAHLDVLVVERVLSALGIRASLAFDARHLADRRRQRDAVHARILGYLARRLERCGWTTATEVQIGEARPRGWIDLLAYRDADEALLIDETKTEIPDLGAVGRSLSFYEREAWAAARRLGWAPRRARVLVTALDSVTLARRLIDNRELVPRMFPAPIADFGRWLADPDVPPPRGWGLGMVDPLARGAAWLMPTVLGSRRRAAAYADDADAAARLRRGRGSRAAAAGSRLRRTYVPSGRGR